jgi:hypothetical protein
MHAWLRDLYRVRNAFGHGRREYDRVAAWRLQSHLLLGAYLFPLAVMARLERDGFYKLTPDDKAKLAAFPWLVSLREPLRWRLRHGGVWNWAMEKAAEAERMRRALAALP